MATPDEISNLIRQLPDDLYDRLLNAHGGPDALNDVLLCAELACPAARNVDPRSARNLDPSIE